MGIAEKIKEQLKYIVDGKYIQYNNESGEDVVIKLKENNNFTSKYYQKALEKMNRQTHLHDIKLAELCDKIKNSKETIFDITTTSKDTLVNIFLNFYKKDQIAIFTI